MKRLNTEDSFQNQDNQEFYLQNERFNTENLNSSHKVDNEESNLLQGNEKEQKIIQRKVQQIQSAQFRALLLKSITIQRKQIGNTVCQNGIKLPFLRMPLTPRGNLQVQQLPIKNIINTTINQTLKLGENNSINPKNKSGMLGNILQYPCEFKDGGQLTTKNVPFFNEIYKTKNQTSNNYLHDTIETLNTQGFHLSHHEDIENLYLLPDGVIEIERADSNKLKYKIQINDLVVPNFHRNNGITKFLYQMNGEYRPYMRVSEGQLWLMDVVHRAYINKINPKVWIVNGIMHMPLQGYGEQVLDRVISMISSVIIPLSLSLLLPVFMFALVHEKEEKIVQMMIMNGLKLRYYWVVTYFYQMTVTLVTFSTFFLFGKYFFKLQMFIETNTFIMIIILVGWGHCQVCLSIFFSILLNKASSATIIGYLLSILVALISVSTNMIVFPFPQEIPFLMSIYPSTAFSRVIYSIGTACSNSSGCYKKWEQVPSQIQFCIKAFYVSGNVILLFGIYLNEVIPKDVGGQRSPLFFKAYVIQMLQKLKLLKDNGENQQSNNNKATSYHKETEEGDLFFNVRGQNEKENDESFDTQFYKNEFRFYQDEDTKREKILVQSIKDYENYSLVSKSLSKVYKAVGRREEHTAIKSFDLAIKNGEIFGLLGPNGAGKTTLISMLTGVFPPSQGDAWIGGYHITKDVSQVHTIMGVCPQFDLLWQDLTVQEHLLFYSRLKGISKQDEQNQVMKAMREVKLEQFKNKSAKSLSGGMRRRLSVAIALVGNPLIVFLDEPSTGLDPENRRQLWDILSQCKGKRAMILTTHSMEEADVLCNRIGIVSGGVLRCVGSQQRLKSLYGSGFHLQINVHKERYLASLLFQSKD